MLHTTLCYIEQDDAYLMLHRVKKKQDVNHDKWIGVGGKLEGRESIADCLLREVFEETGLTLTDFAYRAYIEFRCPPWPEEVMHLFTATGFTGTLKDCDEGELVWVPKSRLEELTLWEGDKIFLRLLAEDAPFFRLDLNYEGDTLQRAVLNGKALPLPQA